MTKYEKRRGRIINKGVCLAAIEVSYANFGPDTSEIFFWWEREVQGCRWVYAL